MEKVTQNTNGQGNVAVNDWEVEIISVDSISIPKHHPRSDFGKLDDLQGSMRRDGIQDPLLVFVTGPEKFGVIDGARRLKAAEEMGWKQVPCLIKKGASEADAAHLSYVKNVERKTLNAVEMARHIQTMRDTFQFTLEELELKGYGSTATISNRLKLLDLSEKVQRQIQVGKLTGGHGLELARLEDTEVQGRMAKKIVEHDMTVRVTADRISNLLAKERKVKKPRPKEIIPAGDIPGVYMKDARDMGEIPDKYVHLIVTSPPYHVGMEYEVGMTFKEHLANVRDVMEECARVLVPGGILVINVGDIVTSIKDKNSGDKITFMGHRYQGFLKKHGVFLEDTILWVKKPAWSRQHRKHFSEDTIHTSFRTFFNWEPVYVFRKKGERELPPEDIVLKSKLTHEQWIGWINGVWEIEANRSSQHGHPCTFPDELVNRLVRMFSYVGDTVLDPFLGSGTTVKVARELGREAIGYERELQYKEVIMRKLDIPFEDTLKSVQQTLKADNWAPDLSVEESPSEMGEDQEVEEAIAEAAEATIEA